MDSNEEMEEMKIYVMPQRTGTDLSVLRVYLEMHHFLSISALC